MRSEGFHPSLYPLGRVNEHGFFPRQPNVSVLKPFRISSARLVRSPNPPRAEAQPAIVIGLQSHLPSNPLLVPGRAALVIFRLLDLLANHTQSLFQELSSLFAIRPLKPHGIDLDSSGRRDDDFHSSICIHNRLHPHEHEFDGPVWLLPAKNRHLPDEMRVFRGP